jgi:hypothetical protein
MKDGIRVMYQADKQWKVAVYGPFKPNQMNTVTGKLVKEWIRKSEPGKEVKIDRWGLCEMRLPPGNEVEIPSV